MWKIHVKTRLLQIWTVEFCQNRPVSHFTHWLAIYAQTSGGIRKAFILCLIFRRFKPLNVFHPLPEQLIVQLFKGQEVIRWKILRKADEWELHYNLMLVPFPRRALLCSVIWALPKSCCSIDRKLTRIWVWLPVLHMPSEKETSFFLWNVC